MVGAKVIVYTDHATLKHLLIKKTPIHDSSVGLCSYKNSIWKSKIRKEYKIVWLLISQGFNQPIDDYLRDDTLLEVTVSSPRYKN